MNTIEYPTQVIWKKSLPFPTALENFSKKHTKRIQFVIDRLSEYTITHTITPIDTEFLDWFKTHYINSISHKTNPNVADIDAMLEPYDIPLQCYGLKIMEAGQVVGGAIYINKKNRVTTALKVFNGGWYGGNLPASPTLYSEYLLYTHARNCGYSLISHGKDSNPYGLNSDIGLCAYKLSLGYTPFLDKNCENGSIERTEIQTDCLILQYPSSGKIITEALLFCTNESLPKYEMVTNYKQTLSIEIVIR